jgi:uncharacterized protein YkwD
VPPPRTITIDSVEPSGPAALWYMSPAPREPIDPDPARRFIAEEIARLAAERRLPPPARDGRLDRAADDLARTTPEEGHPSFELVAFLLSHYGIVEPEPHLFFVRGGPRSERALFELVRAQVAAALREEPRVRVGIGVHRGGGELAVALAFQEHNLELRPVPRALDAGLVAHIEGRLLSGYQTPRVIVTAVDGTVTELRVRERGGRFQASLGCRRDRPGESQLEIAAEGAGGPTVLALFPVFCGVAPPRRSPALALDTSGPADPEEVEAEILKLLNRDRAARGLWPVRSSSRLREVARAHSRDMADTGVVAHVSPRTGNLLDRLRRANIVPLLAAENVGRAYSAAGAQRGFMTSPGHRSNILDARMTTIGIGVARGREENGVSPLFVTQVFAAGID